MRKLLALSFLAGALAVTAMAADVTGKWVAEVEGRGGQTREITFNFKVDGNTLTGTMSGFRGDMPISDGKIDGDQISFKRVMEFNGNSFTIVYKGVVSASGDEIKFTTTREGGEGGGGRAGRAREFTAKRAS